MLIRYMGYGAGVGTHGSCVIDCSLYCLNLFIRFLTPGLFTNFWLVIPVIDSSGAKEHALV